MTPEEEDFLIEPHHEIEVEIEWRVGAELTPKFEAEAVGGVMRSIAALELDDDELAAGREEEEVDEPLEDDPFADNVMPIYDEERLPRIKSLQEDETIYKCIRFIEQQVRIHDKSSRVLLGRGFSFF